MDAVRTAFGRAGIAVDVARDRPERSGGAVRLFIEASLLVTISAFLKAFATSAGEDAYSGLKNWLRGVLPHDDQQDGASVVLRDPSDTELHLPLSPSLPPQAIDALRDIDWTTVTGNELHWDDDDQKWVIHR
jgi:hypothetical protein